VLTNIKSKGNTDLNLDFETQNKYPFKKFDLKSKFKLESPIDLDFETQTKSSDEQSKEMIQCKESIQDVVKL